MTSYFRDDDYFRSIYSKLARDQCADSVTVVNCARCPHVHLHLLDADGVVFATAAIGEDIVLMILDAYVELHDPSNNFAPPSPIQ